MLTNSVRTRTISITRMIGVYRYVGAIAGSRAFGSVATRFPNLPAINSGAMGQAKVKEMKFATGFGGVTGAIKPSATVQLEASTKTTKASAPKKKRSKPKLAKDKLKDKLDREKKKLKAIEKDIKEKTKKLEQKSKERQRQQAITNKEKERKEEEKLKRLRARAMKPVRGLSAWSLYIKKNTSPNKDMKQLSEEFRNLDAAERQKYDQLALDYNAKLKERYPPKPKLGALGYSLYVQQNFPAGLTAPEAMTAMAGEWKQLSPQEKEKYLVITPEIREKHAQELKKWLDDRVANFLEDERKPKVDI